MLELILKYHTCFLSFPDLPHIDDVKCLKARPTKKDYTAPKVCKATGSVFVTNSAVKCSVQEWKKPPSTYSHLSLV
jgi:hypothetical protein